MSSVVVNLIPSKARFSQSRERQRVLVLQIMAFLAAISFSGILFFLVLGWQAQVSWEKTTQTKNLRLEQLGEFDEKVAANQDLQYRLKVLEGILAGRAGYGETIKQLTALMPSMVSLEELSFSDAKKLSVRMKLLETAKMDEVEDLVTRFEKGEEKDGYFKELLMDGVDWENGVWSFSLEVNR